MKANRQQTFRIAVLGIALALGVGSGTQAAPPHYKVVKSLTLGGEGGWDYLNLDPETRRLFITRGDHVMVVNTADDKVVGDITGLSGVHGTAFAAGRAYITNGGANRVTVVDTHTLSKIAEIPVGTRPDGVLYDPASRRVFTFNALSHDATAIDTTTGKVAGTVPLSGKPEAAVADGDGSIFINIEDKSVMVQFDAKSLKIQKSWSLAPCESPSGLAMDVAHHLLFSACDNKMLAVSQTDQGKVIKTVPIGEGPDAARFDPKDGYIFTSNGESGNLSIIREVSPTRFSPLDTVPTATGARTMELDPDTGRIYLVTADRKPGVPTADRPHPRPVPVPGTFRLVIVDRS
jgi:YVTN family beta-propeller protein